MLDKLLTGALQGMMGGQQKQDPLMQILGALLSNREGGEQAASWVGRGQNMPISVEQLMQVFGTGNMQRMAASAGMDERELGGRLADLLPQAVDQLTPEGQVPSGGLDDALGALAKLMPR
mgnify:CR=1 FL=1